MLTALCLLGALEHLFLALPFRDGMLWGWALPQKGQERRKNTLTAGTPDSHRHNNETKEHRLGGNTNGL